MSTAEGVRLRSCPVDGLPLTPKATFCSPRCRAKAFRAARRLVRSECVECGDLLEQKPTGRPRIRCDAPQCDAQRRARAKELGDGQQWEDYMDAIAMAGVDGEGMSFEWSGDYVAPAGFRTEWTIECDLDPLAYADGWDAAGFVAECGRAGFPVGVTLVEVPATLGAGCA